MNVEGPLSSHFGLAGYFHYSGDGVALINKRREMIQNVVYLGNEDIFQTSQRVKKEVAGIFGGHKAGHAKIHQPLCEFRGGEDIVS